MKLFLVRATGLDYTDIYGIFSTREKAEIFIKNYIKGIVDIDEVELNRPNFDLLER